MTIIHADILDWAATYDGPKFHALLCDPPYELGFMNRAWDASGISFQPSTWAALAQHLYPGAFGMAFAGSRTYHRIACAIEDAGLIIHPVILAWSFGSGFPKATRVGKRVRMNGKMTIQPDPRFAGHRYGMQALKPAIEPLIVFQKPYDGSPLACITATGAGALWIDGGRIGVSDDDPVNGARYHAHPSVAYGQYASKESADIRDMTPQGGRWPANLILSHHPACNGVCAPGCPVAALGAQSGESSSKPDYRDELSNTGESGIYGTGYQRKPNMVNDTGTAARFFFNADYMAERIELADAIQYVAKASRAEREAGLDPRQTAIMRLLDDEGDWDDFEDAGRDNATYGAFQGIPGTKHTPNNRRGFDTTTVDDGRETPIDNPYQRGETTRRNIHPTVKPISLTRYLATLLLPPAEYGPRRLLVPFAGAGSECIGADLAGWEDVTGIELEADHVAIANARRAYWQQRRWELLDPAHKLTVKAAPETPQGQLDMFESEAA